MTAFKVLLCAVLILLLYKISLADNPSYKNNLSESNTSERPKIGLALAGGGALGFAHIGVLKVIDSLGIPIDYIAGTSMGGLVGGIYLMGYDADSLEGIIGKIEWASLFNDDIERQKKPFYKKLNDDKYQLTLDLDGIIPKLPRGLIAGQKIQMFFLSLTYPFESKNSFDSLVIPFRCVSADLVTGNEVVHDKGFLAKALRATMSIPSVFIPVDYGDSLLIDGGVLNNFPVDVVKKMGADIVIGLNISTGKKSKEELENMLTILDRTTDLPRLTRLQGNIDLADIYIESDVSHYSLSDFDAEEIKQIINCGHTAAIDNIDKLLDLKNRLSESSVNASFNQKEKRKAAIANEYLSDSPIIHSVKVNGNDKLEFNFIYNNLGIRPGEVFNAQEVDEKISVFYGLDYFESITYELEDVREGYVRIIIKVKEHAKNKFHASYSYDDFYKLIGLVGFETSSVLIEGTRLTIDYQFGGLRKFNMNYFYPSRTLDYPIAPFINAAYKSIPVNIFDPSGSTIAQYKDRSWTFAAGLGLTFGQLFHLGANYSVELIDVKPEIADVAISEQIEGFDDKLSKLDFYLHYDTLDDIQIPTNGLLINAYYEYSDEDIGSDIKYSKLFISVDAYTTLFNKHIIGIGGSHMNSWDAPVYKMFYFGGPDEFWGIDYNQAFGTEFNVIRFDYLFDVNQSLFLHAVFNFGYEYELFAYDDIAAGDSFIGYGAGAKIKTILGVFEIMFVRGDESIVFPGEKTNRIYFTAGFKL